uniref:Uncharacterized protein n=1 Tax=Candidatus Kentrum sp. LFY TaxID=2126342 RepID=A0A450V0L6_9GAMM|nr:MAG: hypothetical protein BECKLFY1418B_GA0070995_11188 [Candidatus Kentron sp. LFY]
MMRMNGSNRGWRRFYVSEKQKSALQKTWGNPAPKSEPILLRFWHETLIRLFPARLHNRIEFYKALIPPYR